MTEWVKISDMEKTRATAMRLDGVSPLSADDIPDTHTITVSERSISVDNSEIIQNNIKTDLIELVLDGEWYDCGSVYVTLGRSAGYDEPVQLEWEGTALTFPAQLGTEVGGIDVSVVGYGNDRCGLRLRRGRPPHRGEPRHLGADNPAGRRSRGRSPGGERSRDLRDVCGVFCQQRRQLRKQRRIFG